MQGWICWTKIYITPIQIVFGCHVCLHNYASVFYHIWAWSSCIKQESLLDVRKLFTM